MLRKKRAISFFTNLFFRQTSRSSVPEIHEDDPRREIVQPARPVIKYCPPQRLAVGASQLQFFARMPDRMFG